MFFVAGVSAKVKQRGVAEHCSCPACGRPTSLYIINKYVTHIFFIPTIRLHSTYLATCALCASVMELDETTGRAFEKSPHLRIHPQDLHILQNNYL